MSQNKDFRIAGYVKLAKLWERSRDQSEEFYQRYYKELLASDFHLIDVYIDITGNKHIYRRKEMVRLLRDCSLDKIDCIFSRSRAFLAPNHEELCYLLDYLFDRKQRIDIVTEDGINTLKDYGNQRAILLTMAKDRIKLDPDEYADWQSNLLKAMNALI